VRASLIQEIAAEDGSQEKVWIYAASRNFKSAETRCSTITRELVAVENCRKLTFRRDFVIGRDHCPLMGLLKKLLIPIENEDIRHRVSQISECSFSVEYVPGASYEFPDWVSRNYVEKICHYQDHQ